MGSGRAVVRLDPALRLIDHALHYRVDAARFPPDQPNPGHRRVHCQAIILNRQNMLSKNRFANAMVKLLKSRSICGRKQVHRPTGRNQFETAASRLLQQCFPTQDGTKLLRTIIARNAPRKREQTRSVTTG
jgi:hypothetical protein